MSICYQADLLAQRSTVAERRGGLQQAQAIQWPRVWQSRCTQSTAAEAPAKRRITYCVWYMVLPGLSGLQQQSPVTDRTGAGSRYAADKPKQVMKPQPLRITFAARRRPCGVVAKRLRTVPTPHRAGAVRQ